MAHVIAITNQKGGVGKTTTAINLGAALAEMGHYTLLGDLDPQGGLSLGLGLAAHDLDLTIYNILTDTRIPVAGITHHIRAHLDLLPSNIDLAVAEFQLIAQMGREYILREALQSVRNQYEYIVLDCPPSLNLLTVNALTASDSIVVPLQVEYFAMRGLEQLMDVVSRVRRRLNPELEIIGIVPTMVDLRRTNDQQILQEVSKAYPGMLLDVYVKESIRFADAPRHQRSILELEPRHDGARAYRQLARIVLKYYGDAVEPEPYPHPEEVVAPPEPAVAAAPPKVATAQVDQTPTEQVVEPSAEVPARAEEMSNAPVEQAPTEPIVTPALSVQEPALSLAVADLVSPAEPMDVAAPIARAFATLHASTLTPETPIAPTDGALPAEPLQAAEPMAQTAEPVAASTLDLEIPIAPQDAAPQFEPYASDKALALLEGHLPAELPDADQSEASSSNGAHPPAEEVPTPALHDVMHPTRDVPRDVIL